MKENVLKKILNNDTSGLIACIIIALGICASHIIGSRIIVIFFLALLVAFSIFEANKGNSLCVLMFFLPWSPVLKIQAGSVSFFTIMLLAITLYVSVVKQTKFQLYQIVIGISMLVITIVSKLIDGNSMDMSYILFIFVLVFFPLIFENDYENINFFKITMYFACGIVVAALSAKVFATYPNIAKFINVDTYMQIIRMSGFYGDSNFYAAHISACLAGVLMLLLCEKSKKRIILLIISAILLFYCGLLSASKSFVIVISAVFMIWILDLIFVQNISAKKVIFILSAVVIVLVILFSTVFNDLLKIIQIRFSYSSNASELTTGRTDLWLTYIKEIFTNPKLFLLGKGFTNIKINGRSTHSTILQILFQFGIIGSTAFALWFKYFIDQCTYRSNVTKKNFDRILLLCIGGILPWIALDLLFFDERFLIPCYICIGVTYNAKKVIDKAKSNKMIKNEKQL